MDYLSMFNEKLKDFLKDVIVVCPNVSEIKILLTGLNLLDKKDIQKNFNENVVIPYEKFIMARDEDFFVNNRSFSEDQKQWGDSNMIGELIQRLKDNWISLSPQNKNAIWDHLTILVVLCKRVHKSI